LIGSPIVLIRTLRCLLPTHSPRRQLDGPIAVAPRPDRAVWLFDEHDAATDPWAQRLPGIAAHRPRTDDPGRAAGATSRQAAPAQPRSGHIAPSGATGW